MYMAPTATCRRSDNGRGIPIDPHPKFKDKSALEVILTTLHAGGKFDSKVYETSGGLHGVGVSVVNALAEHLEVEVARNQTLYRQEYSRGLPQTKLTNEGKVHNRRGTRVRFKPDEQIFGKDAKFKPARLFKMARSKAYLFGGVEIRWSVDPVHLADKDDTPQKAVLHFPGGLKDYLDEAIQGRPRVADEIFAGNVKKEGGHGSVEWAVAWFRRGGRLRQLLLQHRAHARRRHPRAGPAAGAGAFAEELCRAVRQEAWEHDHHRRRDDIGRHHAVGVHPGT
jgi:topoisomerase-4 subunit B